MIVGIGTDICSLDRIEQVLRRRPGFYTKILNEREQGIFEARPEQDRVRYLASRFAAKEAAMKALGTGLAQGVNWSHLEISNQLSGRPQLEFSGRAKELADALLVNACHISLSDEQAYAVAYVVLESV